MEETIYFRSEELPSEQSSVSDTKKEGNTTTTEVPETQVEYPDINAGWHKYTLFKALPSRPSNGDMLRMAYRPITRVFRLPTVAWSGFLYGINLSWYNVLNGIREPEHRLWVLLLAGVMSSAGLITWGVAAHYSVHWVGLVFGLGVLTFGVVTGGSIAVSYNVDCFKEIAGETTVSVMLIRNTIGFGISYGITPWWTTQGLQNCFVTAAMISLACTFTFFLMIKYGRRIRRWSFPAYKQFMATTVVAQE